MRVDRGWMRKEKGKNTIDTLQVESTLTKWFVSYECMHKPLKEVCSPQKKNTHIRFLSTHDPSNFLTTHDPSHAKWTNAPKKLTQYAPLRST